MSGAYYNEIDPYAAAWLRNLIAAGHIAPGDVDERSITDVRADDLRRYRQCHFFAGIGVWSYALRLAGWPDDRAVWTGSCPCQPFSSAGARKGFQDERHLWPAWAGLIAQRAPVVVFGEQVASKDGYAWLDAVQADLEAMDYASGAVVLPASGFGAPHGRHRIFFVADAVQPGRPERRTEPGDRQAAGSGGAGRLEHAYSAGQDGEPSGGQQPLRDERGAAGSLGDAGREGGRRDTGAVSGPEEEGSSEWSGARYIPNELVPSGVVGGFWSNARWLRCTDEKARPVEPGSFPLAYGVAARMDKLRAYGNAINAETARHFIESYLEVCVR